MAAALPANANPRRASLRNPLRLLISAEPWLAFTFMVLSFVLGTLWFVVLVSLIATGFGLSVTFVGIPLLAATLFLWPLGARLERARVKVFLGETIRDPYKPLPPGRWFGRDAGDTTSPTYGNWFEKLKSQFTDRYVWQDLIYLFLLFPIGIAEFVIATVAVSTPYAFLSIPAIYRIGTVELWNNTKIETLPDALGLGLIGIPMLLIAPYILVGVGRGHAWFARHLLGSDRERELEARVGQLTESRSRARDVSVSELQRIERDLHDGAQQRLVKLSMDLGMAREKLDSDPAAARALIEEAHDEAKRAMQEIRDLARGIHPAVLTDRGLDPAISALAGRSTVPIRVEVDLPERLPDAVESTAYFIVAEALTNIARHSGATEGSVRARRAGERLLLDIEDNGHGGAQATPGGGLAGLADRVAAFEGTLSVESPEGGPTRIHAELPCGS